MPLNLNKIDIKLLPVLDALLQERSVTRAAQRVGRSQPAVSHALKHLRELFQNELLVRVGPGYELTAEAEAIAVPLNTVLRQLTDMLAAQPTFDPASAEREFTIATTDYISASILRPAIQKLAHIAPGVRLSIVGSDPDVVANVRNGPGWISIYPEDERPDAQDLHFEFLANDSFCCATWAGNAAVGEELTEELFKSLPHIVEFFMPNPEEVFSQRLMIEKGCRRSYTVRTPFIFLIPFLLEGTTALAVLPRRLADRVCRAADLRIFPLPFETPNFGIEMCWSTRYTTDPAHSWLRSVLRDGARGL